LLGNYSDHYTPEGWASKVAWAAHEWDADVVVAAGATGSISAKLRRLTQGVEDLKTLIVLAAGSAILGKVGIDQTTPGTTDSVTVATAQGAGAAIGATTGAAVVTDTNGTIQQYLRGLVKLIAAKITVNTDAVAGTPTHYNVSLVDAGTQYSQALPENCRRFGVQCRTAYDVRWAVVTGKVAGPTSPYCTLKSGQYYASPAINQAASPSTLYFASAQAGVVMEIEAWV